MTATTLMMFGGLALVGYLLGSIPFGLVITKLAGLGDIRAIGSGNIGATNVLRTGRKDLALATLLLDGGKGAIAVVAARAIGDGAPGMALALVAGLFAVVGHNFPVWLQFKGGKGVATTIGTMFAANPIVGAAACATWLAVAALFRISSLSALVALAATPLVAWATGDTASIPVFAGLAALGWARHHANIRRLLAGQEPKIGAGKAKPETSA
ncbi:MAG: glycerol-3-phosphate 1-O-acyltransferase PlsY [Rhodospirillaceae bacterium]|nr:glycerol-3-phosphate 1-O-acyltransferase PlsY [Rhodospirillaceae bacterium]